MTEIKWLTNAKGKIVGCYSIGQIRQMTEDEIAQSNLAWEKAKKEGRAASLLGDGRHDT